MLKRLKRGFGYFLGIHLVLGVALTLFVVLGPPFVIGTGELEDFVTKLETYDFRWWLVTLSVLWWIPALLIVVVYQSAKAAGLEAERVRGMLHRLVENRSLPVTVDIDHRIPVRIDEPLKVPVKLDTEIDIDSLMMIEAEVPIRTELPINTSVKTNVLGLGALTVPIKARIPLDIVVPVSGEIRVTARNVPVKVDHEALVRLPEMEIPLRCEIETTLNLLSTLQRAEEQIRRGDSARGPR